MFTQENNKNSGGSPGGSQSAGADPKDKESTNPNPDRNTEIWSNGPDSKSWNSGSDPSSNNR